MSTELTITNRAEVKSIIAAFAPETRTEIDKALTLANDFAKAHGDEATRIARQRAIALWYMSKDEKAVEKAGGTLKELAMKLFQLKEANASQYRKAADTFYCNADAPIVKEWYGPYALYLMRDVPFETIVKAVNDKALTRDSTQAQIQSWVDSLKELTDGEDKAEIAKLYDVSIYAYVMDDSKAGHASRDNLYAVTLDELKARMAEIIHAETPEDDRFGRFNPHAELDDGKRKVSGKGLFLAYGDSMVKAVYFKAKVEKAACKATENTVRAQNATIEKLMAEIAKLKAEQAKQG